MEISMKIKAASLLSLCALLATSATQGQSAMEMKPGLWEMRLLKMEADGKDTLQAIRSQTREAQARQVQLPPERRHQIYDPLVQRLCVSATTAKGEYWLTKIVQGTPKPDCTPPKVNYSGEQIIYEMLCKMEGDGVAIIKEGEILRETTMKLEMVITNKISAEIAMTSQLSAISGAKHTAVQESQMKFLGGDCDSLKPPTKELKDPQDTQDGAKKQQY
jgi:hypothetical protein